MKQLLRSQSGLTLIEVSAGLVFLGILATVVNSYSLMRQVGAIKQEKQAILQDTVMLNVAEIHGLGSLSTTPVDHCVARYYSDHGVFLREDAPALLTSAACSEVYSSTAGEIKLLLRFKGGMSATPTFTPAAFLKLPSHSASLVEITIKGSYQPVNGVAAPPLQLTILRRTTT